jgi:L-alanine-DL-glutamate epimerase-like enolase superfamily enzyme
LPALDYAQVCLGVGARVFTGEISAAPEINGSNSRSAIALADDVRPLVLGQHVGNLADVARVLDLTETGLAHNPAVKCGLEHAMWRMVSAATGLPIYELSRDHPDKRRSAKIQCTIPLLNSLDEYAEEFDVLLEKKPDFVKFKIGRNLTEERQAVSMLHKRNPGISISIDANQRFLTAQSALDYVEEFPRGVLAWIEQPLRRPDRRSIVALNGMLKKRVGVPMMLDETLTTVEVAEWFFNRGVTDYINIKPAKHGGFRESERIMALADERGVKYMLGSMLHEWETYEDTLAWGLSFPFITNDFNSYFLVADPSKPVVIDPDTLTTTDRVRGEFRPAAGSAIDVGMFPHLPFGG